jgi:hypothetical protein
MSSENRKCEGPEHLFISYAWEDGALAEWLTLKLTAEGYRVWCDRFKILGGEKWPDDIDLAIRNDTFRMLHLVSKHSLSKPNPKKERELALQLERGRGNEMLIPLNVDGTKPSDLPWRIVDVAYIPFQNWATGLTQLLKKLDSVKTPRPLQATGRDIAGSAFLIRSAITDQKDKLVSNVFIFTSVPKLVQQFRFLPEISRGRASALHEAWAFRNMAGKGAFAFTPPPTSLLKGFSVELTARKRWQQEQTVEGIQTDHLVIELLRKSLDLHCRTRRLVRESTGRGFYFPFGLLPNNKLSFEGANGKRSRILACGTRTFGGRKFRYHLGPWFQVHHAPDTGYIAKLRLRLHLTEETGAQLEHRAAIARRKRMGSSWWNREWLNRQIAVMSFLTEGQSSIKIGHDPETQLVLEGLPLCGLVDRGIDEPLLATIGAPVSLMMGLEAEQGEQEE